MKYIEITPFDLAERFLGVREVAGSVDNPQIMAMLKLDNTWPTNDEVPWCSAFVNYICWLLKLPRSKDLRARSWLLVGRIIDIDNVVEQPEKGFDIVIIKRGIGQQPGPDVINAQGHVGFFVEFEGQFVKILGGNQADSVNVSRFLAEDILGIRRLV